MSVLAAIRPDDVNLALFVHVLGAMLLVGVLTTAVIALTLGSRAEGEGTLRLTRFALRTILLAGIPAWLVMRIGAQWTEAQEDLPDSITDDAWIGIGYIVGDAGGLFIIISSVLAWVGLRKLARGDGGSGQARAVAIISVIFLVAYVFAVWAMTTKPE